MSKLESFNFQDQTLTAVYVETVTVTDGVSCDVYNNPESSDRDLAIVTVDPGKKTPRQEAVGGDQTIEGYWQGKGKLTIWHLDGTTSVFDVGPGDEGFCFSIELGEQLQWQAHENEPLIFFEVCFPPYQEGRFKTINE